MSASTLTTVAFIYKRDYSTHQIADITMRDHVWYAMEDKEDGFGGDSFLYPIRYGNPQGVSGTFSKARTNAKGSKGVQLRALRCPKFGVVTIDGEAALASKGNKKGAFFDLVTMETDQRPRSRWATRSRSTSTATPTGNRGRRVLGVDATSSRSPSRTTPATSRRA
jgi:hypothetical protein